MYQEQTLIEIYKEVKNQPTPCELFVQGLATATHRSIHTAQKWVTGAQRPDLAARHAISNHLGIPVTTLFPEAKSVSDEK